MDTWCHILITFLFFDISSHTICGSLENFITWYIIKCELRGVRNKGAQYFPITILIQPARIHALQILYFILHNFFFFIENIHIYYFSIHLQSQHFMIVVSNKSLCLACYLNSNLDDPIAYPNISHTKESFKYFACFIQIHSLYML